MNKLNNKQKNSQILFPPVQVGLILIKFIKLNKKIFQNFLNTNPIKLLNFIKNIGIISLTCIKCILDRK